LTFEHDLDRVKTNQRSNCLG